MKIGFKQLILTTALAGLAVPAAMAQSADNPFLRGRYVAVDQRQQPEFDPEPVHAGGFDIISSLGLAAEYNDNIFAQSSNEVNDTIIHVRPSVEARSHWSTHELDAGVSVDHNEYTDNDSETRTDYNGFVGGRIDVQRSFSLNGRVSAAHVTEQRYEPSGDVGAPEPAQYDSIGAVAGATFRTDRLQFDGQAGTTENDFNSFFNYRDVTENFVFGRASYAVSPDVAFFVQGRTADLDYDTSNRDGTREWVQVGTSFELQAPFRGEISVGQVKDEKDDPTLRDVDGLSLDGNLMWFPTQLTTITFRGNSGVFDPGIIQVANAKYNNYGVRIDHELLRNVVLFGDLGFGTYDFEGTTAAPYDRKDKFTDVKIGAGYKLNKHARVDAGFTFHNQDSSGANADRDLDQNIFSIGLKLYP